MDWLRRHPGASVAALGLLAVAVVVATVLVALPSDRGPALVAVDRPRSAAPTVGLDPKDAATRDDADPEDDAGEDDGRTVGATALRGLDGRGISLDAPRHTVRLRVTSASPIGTLGYIIPTSRTDSYGRARASTSWSLTTTVYGSPDYAQVFIQAGAKGDPITCTITVDGTVTERRTIDGPWAQMLCQG